jgi:glycerol uptake facilitator-like aquaporin
MNKIIVRFINCIHGKTRQFVAIYSVATICILVLSIKLILFIIDPHPQFFLGDSATYLNTAINNGIPVDRSFVYGFLIQYLTHVGHSLTPLIFTQILCSISVALLVYYVTRKYFSVRAPFSIIAACCCALDPMQLYYERAVMTETFSTFVFAICIVLAFDYLLKARFYILVILALSCTFLISLRMTFLPSTLVICILPPLYLLLTRTFEHDEEKQKTGRFLGKSWKLNKTNLFRYFSHLTLAGVCIYASHTYYKNLNGYLLNREPAFMHTDGLFMIAGVAPLLTRADSPDPRFADVIDRLDDTDLKDFRLRAHHRFITKYLVGKLNQAVPDLKECNDLAKKTAINSLFRSPFDTLVFGCCIYLDYFDKKNLKERIKTDQGDKPNLSEENINWLRDNYSIAVTANWGKIPTFTKRYQLKLRHWNYVLVLGPIISVFGFIAARRRNFAALLVLMLASLSMLPGICLFSIPVYRYFHTFGFIVPIILAILADQAWTYLMGSHTQRGNQ